MGILEISLEMQRFCDQHKLIESYHCEPMDKILSQNLKYPLVWFIPQSGSMKAGAVYHQVKILFLELTNKDNSSGIESYNNCVMLAEDFNTYFYNRSDEFNFDMDINTTFEPITMDFADAASGCVLTVDFQYRTQRDESQILLS